MDAKKKKQLIKNFKTMQGVAKMTIKSHSRDDCQFLYVEYTKLARIYFDAMRKKERAE